ncbi:hypothetical protein [Maribacter flavus]|uniref:Uncharacterized protein n=1 Tax=Maribacter flavus TaxID=1658664 RepID=A0A5B2TVL2_9FLAO|nr:hypothetical protein [Maribacter flavus]KAA2218546.1 hypothetical protein F0361_02685 [Maribacter flavus]
MEDNSNNPNALDGNRVKDSKQKLISYLDSLKFHPNVKEHKTIAQSFGFPSYKEIFRQDAIRRVLQATSTEPTTAATIEKLTGVKQKYVCQIKRQLEKSGELAVAYLGKCPTTGSTGVQFLTSDVELIKSLKK